VHAWKLLLGCFAMAAHIAGAAPARAQEALPGVFGFQFENDAFGFGDDHYTNGMRMAYVLRSDEFLGLQQQVRKLDALDAGRLFRQPPTDISAARVTLSLGQSMFTPGKALRDETTAAAIAADRMYGGWLYGGLALHVPFLTDRASQRQGLNTVEIDIGVIGPKAHADDVQTWWHNVNDWKPFLGWDNQLLGELTAQLVYRSTRRLLPERALTPNAPVVYDAVWNWGF